jgi:hypothetical protein
MAIAKPARTFQDLLVWQKAHRFVWDVYTLTAAFPKQETYGLSLQMRRAAVSIPANIAEGFRRRSKADKARFMNMAEGACRRMSLFSDPRQGSRIRRYPNPDRGLGRSQQISQRLRHRHSDFLDFCLLTPISRRDIKAKPWLVSLDLEEFPVIHDRRQREGIRRTTGGGTKMTQSC